MRIYYFFHNYNSNKVSVQNPTYYVIVKCIYCSIKHDKVIFFLSVIVVRDWWTFCI